MKIYITLIFFFLAMAIGGFAVADDNIIAVFSPKAKEPYQSIYQSIISGARSGASKQNIEFKEFLLDKNFDSKSIIKELIELDIQKVIVLGRSGWKLGKELSEIKVPSNISKETLVKRFHVVSGALPISPNGMSGISLVTDPIYLFDYLQKVAPNVSVIHAAYSEKSEWLIELAINAASSRGLKLDFKKVKDTKEAIDFYQKIFDSDIGEKDSIWLPLDSISSHDKITLPLILEKSWAKGIVVFSSKPSHAKRGALFSTYPDNYPLGERLFKMIQSLENQPEQKDFSPLKSTLLAVNLRTAAHLGLKYSAEQQQEFKLTFPE